MNRRNRGKAPRLALWFPLLIGVVLATSGLRANHQPGAPANGPSPGTDDPSVTQDRGVRLALAGDAADPDSPEIQQIYRQFQQALQAILEDEGQSEAEQLQAINRLIDTLGRGPHQDLDTIASALKVRYAEVPRLAGLLDARILTTAELLRRSPPTLAERVVLEDRIRDFAGLLNLPDQTARLRLSRYFEALRRGDTAARGAVLAELMSAQGQGVHRRLSAVLNALPENFLDPGLKADLLSAALWKEHPEDASGDATLREAFQASYRGEQGKASRNRDRFWTLMDEAEAARKKGDEARLQQLRTELQSRWGSNLGAFLEGMRKQAVAEGATEEERHQANEVLSRVLAVVGETRRDGEHAKVVVRYGEENPVDLTLFDSEKDGTDLGDPLKWNLVDKLTRHVSQTAHQDSFGRPRLLNSPVLMEGVPVRTEIAQKPTESVEGSPPSGPIPPQEHAPPSAPGRTASSAPQPPRKVRLYLTSCPCTPEWFGSNVDLGRLNSEVVRNGRVILDNVPGSGNGRWQPDSLPAKVEAALRERGVEAEIVWEVVEGNGMMYMCRDGFCPLKVLEDQKDARGRPIPRDGKDVLSYDNGVFLPDEDLDMMRMGRIPVYRDPVSGVYHARSGTELNDFPLADIILDHLVPDEAFRARFRPRNP